MNKSFTRRSILAATAAASVFLLADQKMAWAMNEAPRKELRIGMSGYPKTLDPVIATDTAIRRIMPQVFESLIARTQDEKMSLTPGLATDWERIDPQTLRLHLRKGVKFQDGMEMTAEDVAFSLGQVHLLGPGGTGATEAVGLLGHIDDIKVEDTYTVVIHTKTPDPLLEQRLASWGSEIVSKHSFDAAGSWQKWTDAPVGTGPYRIVSKKLDVNVVLEPFDQYWGGRPNYSKVEYRIIPELASRVNALKAGELDLVTDIPPDQFAEIKSAPDLEVAGGPVQNIRSIVFDTNDTILKDARIRRAMSLAIDRKLLVESLWDNVLPVPNAYQLPSYGDGYIKDYPELAYDPAKAKELLADAGYKGEQITYRLLNNYYPNQVSGAQVMIEMWRAIGLNVKIQMMENWGQIEGKPIHAIYDSSNTALFPDILGHAWRETGPLGAYPHLTGTWQNQEYFDLGAKLATTMDVAARQKLIRQMLDIITEIDPPSMVLHVSGQFYGKRKDLHWVPGQTLGLDFGPGNPGLNKP